MPEINRSIMTHSGKTIDFLDPDPEQICIEDIARGLALCNRYNGHTKLPYSVAEHCVRMSEVSIHWGYFSAAEERPIFEG
jgi:hypothetical protein